MKECSIIGILTVTLPLLSVLLAVVEVGEGTGVGLMEGGGLLSLAAAALDRRLLISSVSPATAAAAATGRPMARAHCHLESRPPQPPISSEEATLWAGNDGLPGNGRGTLISSRTPHTCRSAPPPYTSFVGMRK